MKENNKSKGCHVEILSIFFICGSIAGRPAICKGINFEDKYDLLGYCWYCLVEKIFIKDHECHNPEENLFGLFDRIYDFCLEHITGLIKILKYNTKEGIMYNHFRMYMNTSTREIFYQCSQTKPCKIPYEILADHYSNTILLILEWSFLKENTCSKEQAHYYLNYLVAAL